MGSMPKFYATFSFALVAMAILCALFTVASIRTNAVLFTVLLLLVPTCKYLAYISSESLAVVGSQIFMMAMAN